MVANVDFSGPRRLLVRVVIAKIREYPFPAALLAAITGFVFLHDADRIAAFGAKIPPVARHATADELGFLFEVIGAILVAVGGGYLFFRTYRILRDVFVRTTCHGQIARIHSILKDCVGDPRRDGLVSAAFIYRGHVIYHDNPAEAAAQIDRLEKTGLRVNALVDEILAAHRETSRRMEDDLERVYYRFSHLKQGPILRLIVDLSHGGILYYHCFAHFYVMGGIIEQAPMETMDGKQPTVYRQMERLADEIRKEFGLAGRHATEPGE